MSTIVWTTLITAAATVSAALGAVWIKSEYDDRSQARQAVQNRATAREDQQRQAYGELVKTARLALGNFRQLGLAYAANTPDIPAVNEAFTQTASLDAEINQAAALAELAGSPSGRKHARAIYDKAKACANLFQIRELLLAAVPNTPVGKLLAGALPEGFWKAIPLETRKAEAKKAGALCDDLEAAIDQFIEAVSTELAPVIPRTPPSAVTPPDRTAPERTPLFRPPEVPRSFSSRALRRLPVRDPDPCGWRPGLAR